MATEQDLIGRAKAGDQDAFATLVRDNQDRIYNLALRMVRNPDDAAELAQEAFFSAWKSLPKFQEESAFSTWLYRLTTNLCIDFLRREKRRHTIAKPVSLDDTEDKQAIDLPDHRHDPPAVLQRNEVSRTIQRGLDSLTEGHRQVLVMREMDGLSYGEIAEILDVNEGTIKSRIARARISLRKYLLTSGNFSNSLSSKEKKTAKGGESHG